MAPRKRPAKKAAAKKKAAPKRQTAAQKKKQAAQEAALQWAVTFGAPLGFLDGWDPETGEWAEKSKVAAILDDVRQGTRPLTASRQHRLERLPNMVAKGRELMAEGVSENRDLIPIEVRPFVDLAIEMQAAEAEAEGWISRTVFAAIAKDPRLGLTFLARRWPDGWGEKQELFAQVEFDPRRAAVKEMMQDPNVARQLAELSRQASERAAQIELESS